MDVVEPLDALQRLAKLAVIDALSCRRREEEDNRARRCYRNSLSLSRRPMRLISRRSKSIVVMTSDEPRRALESTSNCDSVVFSKKEPREDVKLNESR
jgi:hypothetical protein